MFCFSVYKDLYLSPDDNKKLIISKKESSFQIYPYVVFTEETNASILLSESDSK